ncbi:MAG: hypothetical protein EOP04_19005 [Proteobacteria bacterium]|nr:MAG: hypothetical protein EOP04_19005 [Pseudomonadota bacterium]
MKIFEQPNVLYPSARIIEKAKQFTDAVIGTVDYSDSNQSNKIKVWEDHFVSKIGEEAVAYTLRKLGCSVVGPDYGVYAQKDKNWNDDLTVDEENLAVKTQRKSSSMRYGLSWTFQSGSYRKDPILTKTDAWVCFVHCDDTNDEYRCVVYPPRQMGTLLLGGPKLARLIGSKKVVYANENGFDDLL